MLKINLLPLEKRRPERTPLPRFLAILAVVAGTGSLIAVLIGTYIAYRNAATERDNMKADLATPKTAEIQAKNKVWKDRQKTYEARKNVLRDLRPKFQWSEVLDLLCDKLDATHKKVWFEEIKAFEPNDLRMKQQETGFDVEAGMIVDSFSAGHDPAPLLAYRIDLVQRPKPPVEQASAARKPARVLVDYFTGAISRNITFTLKEQADFEEGASQNFKTEFYIRKGGAAPKK